MSDEPLRFRQPTVNDEGSDSVVRLPIDGHPTVEFRVKGGLRAEYVEGDLGDLCLAVGVIPAMRLGVPLRVDAPVCRLMLNNMQRIQHVFSRWYPDQLSGHAIHAEAVDVVADGQQETRGAGAFFSGGVDSLYTVFRELGELTELVFVQGFDIPHDDEERIALVRPRVAAAAGEIGRPLTEVWTNIREFSEPLRCYWGHHYFGSALGAVSQLLSPRIAKSFIPSSTSYDDLVPWGSHVVTDGLWASRRVETIHHGSEASRTERIKAIAGWPVARHHLRVCWEGGSHEYNCGRCEKCMRTMAALQAVGAGEEFAGLFEAELDLGALAATRAPAPAFLALIRDILRHAEMNGAPDALVAAIRASSEGSEADLTVKRFANQNNAVLASAEWRRLLPKVRNKLFRSIYESDPAWFVGRLEKVLPEQREAIVDLLHRKDPKWLKRALRKRRWRRRQHPTSPDV